MALYHVRLKVFSRTRGESATAAAAYRAGVRIEDERTGEVHDYTKRRGVERVDFFAPAGAAVWASNPSALFNACEAAEVRGRNGRVAREAVVALPAELSAGGRADLVGEVCRWLVNRYGVATMAATHAPDARGDQRNHHAHILMTTRRVGPEGLGAKVRVLDDRATGPVEVRALREAVADITNRHLARAGLAERVDHRTLKAQADDAAARGDYARAIVLTRRPTVHLGRSITAMRRRNLLASDTNMHIRASNRIIFSDYLRLARGASALRVGSASRVRIARPEGPGTRSYRNLHPSGPGARAIAAQARQVQRRQRQDERATRRFAAMLERVRVEITEQNRRTVLAYTQVFGRTLADAEALALHGQRDPGCFGVLRRALEARRAVEEARVGLDTARNRRGEAMVRTAEARAALERTEAEPAPSRLRVLSRREWAQKREAQRIALAQAKWAEEGASERSGVRAEMERVNLAKRALDEVEAQRRRTYGVPGDDRPSDVKPSAPTPPALVQRPSPRVVRRPCRP